MKINRIMDLKKIEKNEEDAIIGERVGFIAGVILAIISSQYPAFLGVTLLFFAIGILGSVKSSYWGTKWYYLKDKQEAKKKK